MVSRAYVHSQKVKMYTSQKWNCVSLSNSQNICVGSKICKLNAYVPHCNVLMCYSGPVISYFVLGFLYMTKMLAEKRKERKRHFLAKR